MVETLSGAYQLEVISPERILFDMRARAITVMGEAGSLGVLPGHAPLVTALVPCELVIRPVDGPEQSLAIGEGFLEVSGDHVRVLVDSAERPDEIDVTRAEGAKQRAAERLARRGSEDIDYARAEAALRRAIARLKTAGKL